MDCLTNYIGLIGCGDVTPASGLFINSLAGITNEVLENAASREQVTGRAVWDDVQAISARRIYTDTLAKLRPTYRLKTAKNAFEYTPGTFTDTLAPVASELRGVRMQFSFTGYTFQSFTVATLYFRAGGAANDVVFSILDKNGNTLWTKTTNIVEGLNEISVDKIFPADTIFIAVDASAITTGKTTISEETNTCFCQSVSEFCEQCDPAIGGYTYAGGSFTSTSGNSHGIGMKGYFGCDYASIICSNKELFTSALLFLLGNQSIIHLLGSSRINKLTTVDRERFIQLRDFYQVEYEKQLEQAVAGIYIDIENDCCVECNDPIKKVQWLP